MRTLLCFLSICFAALCVPAASADTYSFSSVLADGTAVSANFTTTPDASQSGALDITAVSGTVGNDAIVSLVPSDYSPNGDVYNIPSMPGWWLVYDNLLFAGSGQVFDDNGVLFQTASGLDVNLFRDPNQGFMSWDANNQDMNMYDVTLTPEAPEPSSLLLSATGLLVAGVYQLRSRRRGRGPAQGI